MAAPVPSLLRQELERWPNPTAHRRPWSLGPPRRQLEVDILYNAEGSAKVTWGDTVVYAGVKFELRTRGRPTHSRFPDVRC